MPAHVRARAQVLSAKVKLMSLQEALLQLALDAEDAAALLAQEHGRALGEMAEANKLQFNAFFAQVTRSVCNARVAVTPLWHLDNT